MTNPFSKDRLKAVAAGLTALIGLATAVLSYSKLNGTVATDLATVIGILTPIAAYITTYVTTNQPTP